MDNQQIIYQFGITEGDGVLYRAVRDFFLNTVLGPPTVIKSGSLIMVSPKAGVELFYGGKAEPENLGEIFEVVRETTIIENGEWKLLEVGDIVKLERSEGIELLRKGVVREKGGKI